MPGAGSRASANPCVSGPYIRPKTRLPSLLRRGG
jgi:hypothetical protein